ncbi:MULTISPECIES: phage major capsid protein [unclassified Xanthobacter]|uniref:phage major capsid protein n=1 Tax=unclassified Xanthobacter TaxID=2623496 RepID=UPI001F384E50|nr:MULTISPECIES: phage major capsid protein [unclassified Xanthobacter]
MERLDIELKAIDAGATGEIEGLAWPFGFPDRVGDVIEKGAFAGARLPLPMLFGHDMGDPVGAWTEATESPDGLRLKGKMLVDDVARAREVHAMVRAGAVKGLSVGFQTTKAVPRKGGGRTISALDLLEVSLVTVPMHPGARVTAVKGAEQTDMSETTAEAPETKTEAPTVDVAAIVTKAVEPVQKGLSDRLDKLEAKLNRPGIISDTGSRTLEQKAYETFLRRGEALVPEVERKALTVANDASAGYLVAPDPLMAEILKTVTEFSPMRQVARVAGLSSGGAIIPRRTSAPAAAWVGETDDRPETTAAYEQVSVTTHEAACWVDVSQRLLEDSAFNIEGELAAELGLAFAKLEATAFVAGSGTGQPMGFLADTGITDVASGAAAALTGDSLIDLYHAIPTAYVGQAVWAMNRKTMATVRKLKATDGTYLWADSLAAGNPPTILGRPVMEFADLADVAADARPMAFGDFGTAYRIFDRVGLSIMRDPYTQATKGIVRFHARRRVGGLVVMPEALRTMKIMAS